MRLSMLQATTVLSAARYPGADQLDDYRGTAAELVRTHASAAVSACQRTAVLRLSDTGAPAESRLVLALPFNSQLTQVARLVPQGPPHLSCTPASPAGPSLLPSRPRPACSRRPQGQRRPPRLGPPLAARARRGRVCRSLSDVCARRRRERLAPKGHRRAREAAADRVVGVQPHPVQQH